MSSNATPPPTQPLTVGTIRKLLEGIDDNCTVWIGAYDTGVGEWCEERSCRVAISYGPEGAECITIEGVR